MAKFGFMGLRRVKVAGESMSPTYNNGDVLLVKWFTGIERELPLASVVVIERDEMPGVFFIKRIQKSHSGAYWVEGDNDESTDSRSWGWIPANEVVGVVLFRYKRGKDLPTPKL